MQASRFVPIFSALVMAVLAAPAALLAQEVVEVTGRDQRIDAAFAVRIGQNRAQDRHSAYRKWYITSRMSHSTLLYSNLQND